MLWQKNLPMSPFFSSLNPVTRVPRQSTPDHGALPAWQGTPIQLSRYGHCTAVGLVKMHVYFSLHTWHGDIAQQVFSLLQQLMQVLQTI